VIRIDEKPTFTASGEPALRIWADDPALREAKIDRRALA
jgi:hypothetical protein